MLIMDYKSGRRALTLQDVYDGLELQLMIYMAVSLYNLGDAAVPAGAVYCPVRNDIRNEAADPAEEKKKALYMRSNRFAGFYLSETDVAELLDKTVLENSSPFSGLHINQKGVFSSSARVYDEAGWSGLVNLAEARVREIAEKLTDGRIAVAPARWGKAYEHKACDYCPYTAVCRFDLTAEDGNRWNFATAKKDDEIMKELGGEESDMDKSAE